VLPYLYLNNSGKMKKILLTISIIIGVISTSYGQAWDGIGDKKASAGLEFYGFGTGIIGNFDYGIHEDISIGAGMNFNFDLNNLYINARGDYHFQRIFQLSSEWDAYAGLDLGFNTNYDNRIGFGAHIGGRYMFTDAIGAFLEIGNRGGLGVVFNL